LNLEGLSSPVPHRVVWTGLNFAYDVIIEIPIKK